MNYYQKYQRYKRLYHRLHGGNSSMKKLVISLRSSQDRRRNILNYFNNVDFIDAIDGKQHPNVVQSPYRQLNPGEIGCFKSHRKVWEIISHYPNNDWVMVLEDDAKPYRKEWKNELSQGLKELDDSVGFVYLHKSQSKSFYRVIDKVERIANRIDFETQPYTNMDKQHKTYTCICSPRLITVAYCIRPSIAKQLLQATQLSNSQEGDIYLPVDIQIHLYKIKMACFQKGILCQDSQFDSLIR